MYSATARGLESLVHEVENTLGEHISPASGDRPALATTRKVLASTMGFTEASSTFDQM